MKKNYQGLEDINYLKENLRHDLLPLSTVLISGALGFMSLAGLLYYQIYKQEVIPYIVTIDRQGAILGSGAIKAADGIPEEIIATTLCDFLEKLRSFGDDPDLKRRDIEFIYAHLKPKSPASRCVDDFFKAQDPFLPNHVAKLELQNLIRVGAKTFQIDWIETEDFNKNHNRKKMRAQLIYELVHIRHRSINTLKLNPLGIFVKDIRISERFENQP
jgi:type IV secretory pathway TrbF-like protein